MNTTKLIANYAVNSAASGTFSLKTVVLGLCTAVLAACSTPQPPAPKAVYDFGAVTAVAASTGARQAPLQLADIEATGGPDSTALLYRLTYADAQQLRPYAAARWSVPPAQLLRTRLRDALATQGPVLGSDSQAAWSLRVELDEFSHVFASPSASQGLVRLRASLFKSQQLAAQTTLLSQAPAATQDAPGGVKALTAASDDAVRQLAEWVQTQVQGK